MAFDTLRESSERRGSLQLLPEQALLATSAVDHADWNYRPILGRIQRLRFDLIRSTLCGSHAKHLLEIGYGSGIFFPELANYADDLHGIDPHPFAGDITRILSNYGVRATLVTGTAVRMPYIDSYFQTVVAVSALEFVDDLPALCREVKRILEPGGIFAIVTPAHSPILDLGVRVMTGVSPQADFQNRRQGILSCLYQEFVVDQRADYPPFAHGVRLYTALRLSVPGTR
jgi:SAM-dependent methyltransferase